MTKNEIQVQYHSLCAKIGHQFIQLQVHQEAVKTLTAQMNDLLKERVALEEALKTATDEPTEAPIDV